MSNSVDIYINGHERDLLQAIERTKAAIASLRDSKATVTVDVDDGALNVLKAKLAAMRDGDVTVDVNVNDAKLAALRAKMDALRNTRVKVTVDVDRTELNILKIELAGLRDRSINVGIDSDLAGFRAALAASTLGNANARINLDLDTAGAAAELAAFLAAVPRSVTINLDVDTAGAAAELAAFRVAMLALNDDSIRLGASTGGNAAAGIARMGASAGSSLPLIGALALAVAPIASGAVGVGILGTAAALGVVTAAAGGMSVAFGLGAAALPIAAAAASEEVKSSFTTMKDDVVSTMKEIAQPVEQPLIDLAGSLGTAFESIRPSLDVVTAGAARLVNELSGKMPAIANEVGPALEKMFSGAEPHIKNLIGNIPEYVRAFGDFAGKLGDPAIVEGAQRVFGAIPGIIDGAGDALVGAGNAFGDIMGFLDAGKLDGFTEGIGNLFENLGNTDWSGVTSGLADMGNAFGDFVANVDTQNLATNLEGLSTFAADVTRISGEVVAAYGSMDEAFRQSNEDAGGGPIEWGAKAADWMKSSLLDSLGNFSTSGLFDTLFPPGDVPEIPAPEITPPDTSAINDPFAMLPPAVLPPPVVTPPDAGAVNDPFAAMPPAVLPAPVVTPPDTSAIGGALENIAPPTIEAPVVPAPEVTPAPPIPAPEVTPPPPVPVEVEVVEGAAVTVPPPAPVPITFDVTQPELVLTPPPPVPITFNVTLPVINIPPPAPVPVSVDIDTAGAKVNLSGQGAAAGQSFASGLAGSAGAVASAAASMAAAAEGVSVNLSAQGSAAGASFAAGLASQAGAVAAAAAQLGAVASANKGVYKGRKGIAADRIMLIPHGQAMVKGFIDGLGSQRRELITEASSLAKAVTKRFDEELVPNIGLSGGVGVQQQVFVTVEAGLLADPVKVGREIKDAVGAYISAVGGSETISV